jgi:2-amino-4-hydroxy-6-hydroxymethyldihydropteridine diphosphokinase
MPKTGSWSSRHSTAVPIDRGPVDVSPRASPPSPLGPPRPSRVPSYSGRYPTEPMISALIGLGSNLGDRAANLAAAIDRLRAAPGIRGLRASRAIETAPVGDPAGGPLGGPYLNAVAEVFTDLDPRALLGLCLSIEEGLGRTRPYPGAPRTIDLDILLYGDRVVDEPGLIVPHPRMLDRRFVLEPLAEIAPDRRHPITGRTALEHWQEWRSRHDLDR